MTAILDVADLRVERGRTTILHDVSWRIARGQHWVILGANGSGKTSLLKTLTGYLVPTAGRIEVLGHRFGQSDWRELRLHVGVVMNVFSAAIPLAEVALDTVISGKYAQLDLWHRVTSADRAAALRQLRRAGIAHLAQRPWVHLSQGERQRVLIARALMARPRLLILDEPCAGLDPVARAHFLAFVQQLSTLRGAPSLVLVTHHVEEITPAFSHLLLLRRGTVLAAGERARLLTSANLSAVFEAPCHLRRSAAGLRLEVRPV
ncbi:ATP-binding cassette domain-containing protein [Horticoccus luteus]|uniref:ATP-binding cassette domain-containing protein n=1 Tax=Horticoccus luteus TaxID=2862869 RepID=A0A8F9XKX6_9BACT|nr:ATP-binding cassette domain-containing protein [Horticoccus luteus]QYM78489.1 ATP-binding cassette domain-containing protein [Horticoccus luteus]